MHRNCKFLSRHLIQGETVAGYKQMQLFIKALIGAGVVVLIQLLTRSQNYYIAGLVPLFPTFALISHYMVG